MGCASAAGEPPEEEGAQPRHARSRDLHGPRNERPSRNGREALADCETSALEGHLETWLDDLVRVWWRGAKPGSGVDLRVGRASGTECETASVVAARMSKLYAGWRIVEPYVAVLRAKPSRQLRADPGSTKRASDDLWEMVSGAPDFGPRSLQASTVLAAPVAGRRASADVARIQAGSIH